jgi:hypothetical protein
MKHLFFFLILIIPHETYERIAYALFIYPVILSPTKGGTPRDEESLLQSFRSPFFQVVLLPLSFRNPALRDGGISKFISAT